MPPTRKNGTSAPSRRASAMEAVGTEAQAPQPVERHAGRPPRCCCRPPSPPATGIRFSIRISTPPATLRDAPERRPPRARPGSSRPAGTPGWAQRDRDALRPRPQRDVVVKVDGLEERPQLVIAVLRVPSTSRPRFTFANDGTVQPLAPRLIGAPQSPRASSASTGAIAGARAAARRRRAGARRPCPGLLDRHLQPRAVRRAARRPRAAARRPSGPRCSRSARGRRAQQQVHHLRRRQRDAEQRLHASARPRSPA